jgi:hypothetical protein
MLPFARWFPNRVNKSIHKRSGSLHVLPETGIALDVYDLTESVHGVTRRSTATGQSGKIHWVVDEGVEDEQRAEP